MRVLSGAFLLGDLVTQVDQVTRYNFVQMQMSYFRELLKLDVFSILPAAYDHFFKLCSPKLFLFFSLGLWHSRLRMVLTTIDTIPAQ